MTNKFIAITVFTSLLFISCGKTVKQDTTETTKIETVEGTSSEIITRTIKNENGEQLRIRFNNDKGIASVKFNGEKFDLEQQKAASGIWFKNDVYELRGKGNDIDLKKDGKIIFTHKDDIIERTLANKDGDTLSIIYNNTTNTAKVYLNGGEQIDLEGQKPASGIWYTNNNYELRGKGEKVELLKDDTVVFKN